MKGEITRMIQSWVESEEAHMGGGWGSGELYIQHTSIHGLSCPASAR